GELREANALGAGDLIRAGEKRLPFLKVDARRLELGAIARDAVAHVLGIDLERLLVLYDRVVPILRLLRALRFLIGGVAGAGEERQDEEQGRDCVFQSIHLMVVFPDLLNRVTARASKRHDTTTSIALSIALQWERACARR